MKDDNEILILIEKKLEDAMGDLWDALIPEERKKAFSKLIFEYIESSWGS